MVLIFGNSELKATFPAAVHRVLGTGLPRLPKERERERERERRRERERDRKSHCLGLWDNQFALPLFVCFSFADTLSAQHCTFLIHCTVCPVSTVFLALSTLVCPSLGSGHFSDTGLPLGVATAIYFYTDHLRSFPTVCTVMAFVRAFWGWQSPAATHSPIPSGIENF